jgi:hypothetical protein
MRSHLDEAGEDPFIILSSLLNSLSTDLSIFNFYITTKITNEILFDYAAAALALCAASIWMSFSSSE